MKRYRTRAALLLLAVLASATLASCGGSGLAPTALFWDGAAPPAPPSLEPARGWDLSDWT